MALKNCFFLSLGVAAFLACSATLTQADIVSPDNASRTLVARNLSVRPDGTVSGTLVNKSLTPVGDVRLLIRHTFLWKRERRPGDPRENPSRSFFFNLPDILPPEGVTSFTAVPPERLPRRQDGKFETTVEIFSYRDLSEEQ